MNELTFYDYICGERRYDAGHVTKYAYNAKVGFDTWKIRNQDDIEWRRYQEHKKKHHYSFLCS